MNIEAVKKDLLRYYEDMLCRENNRLKELRAAGLCNDDDLARVACTQDIDVRAIETEREIWKKIVEALRRINNGTFGFCTLCEGEIAPNRLNAVPYEPLCISCQKSEDNKRVVPKIPTGLTQPAYW